MAIKKSCILYLFIIRLLIIMQWAGYVKLDEWKKSLCINEGLMILFEEISNKINFSILIMNQNERYDLYGIIININMKEHTSSDTKKLKNKNI